MVGNGFGNADNISDWELGRRLVRERKFSEANKRFFAEIDHNDSANRLVLNDHGHLFNMMGEYENAIVKFDSFLSSHSDYVSSLFGKGISCMGLNKLDEAKSYFDKVLEIDGMHADAWYYSAIILGNPFYHNYDCSLAKERYENYQDLKEDYIKNPSYFDVPFDDLSLEEVHGYYKVSDFFRLIEQLLERGNIGELDNVLKVYGRLYCFEDDFDELFDIFRLFDDVSLVDKIDRFNRNKNIEERFESAGFDDDLSSRFGCLSIEDKGMLVELMDYFKGSRLSLDDINDLIREYVFEGEMSLVSFNEIREDIVKNRIGENDYIIARNVEKKVNSELNYYKEENNKLKEQYELLYKEKESLSKENDNLNQKIQIFY